MQKRWWRQALGLRGLKLGLGEAAGGAAWERLPENDRGCGKDVRPMTLAHRGGSLHGGVATQPILRRRGGAEVLEREGFVEQECETHTYPAYHATGASAVPLRWEQKRGRWTPLT